jgi:Mrp family chromosome partitioning ATPase
MNETAPNSETPPAATGPLRQEEKARDRQRLDQKLSHIRHRIMVMSGKGGVGKTMVAINLAVAMAQRGFRVGILDGDIHGPNVPKMLGIDKRHLAGAAQAIRPVEVFRGLKAVSMALVEPDPDKAILWRGPMKHAAIKQFLVNVNWGELDFLVVDLPPGTGDEPLSVAHLIQKVDGAIIVTTPQDVALLDSRKAVNFSKRLSVPVLGIVENMSGLICPHCGGRIDLFKVGGGQRAAEELGVPFLGRIPIDPLVVEKCDSGKLLMADDVVSAAKTAMLEVVDKIFKKFGLKRKAPPKIRFEADHEPGGAGPGV